MFFSRSHLPENPSSHATAATAVVVVVVDLFLQHRGLMV